MSFVYSTHNFKTWNLLGFDVIRSKVSQIELKSLRKSDTVLTQYAEREIPPICQHVELVNYPLNLVFP